ncbi:MAG: Meiotic Sister-Chromatid recombination aldehyde dehydrogenase, partial [Tremellales sp. Tagirdzhanova-0007]
MPLLATPYPHVMNQLNGPTSPKYTFLVFYASVVDGQMWCPDCRNTESTVREAFDSPSKPKAIIYWVGTKTEWRTSTNKARTDWDVQAVPTILRIEGGKEMSRLVDDEILDTGRMEAFLSPTMSLDHVEWLSSLTLGEIWRACYNPPTPILAILVVALGFQIPRWYKFWIDWNLSRKVWSFDWPEPEEANPKWTGRTIESPTIFSHLQDETLLSLDAAKTGDNRPHITCYDPSTSFFLTALPLLSAAEIASQIKCAHDAQPDWARTSVAVRKSFLRSLKQWVMRDMDGIVRVACRDTGKTGVDAVFGEILTTLAKIDWLVKHGEKVIAPQPRPGNLLLAHKISTVHYEPLGTTLALVSWNYSFHNLLSPILASLFVGNTVVVKCSEQVAWSSMWFFGAVKACLRACGLDQDVVQLVICMPDVAETVTRNRMIRHITFIGSESVGRKVAAAAAEIMVPACIELGGKDPAFILPSADLDFFA